LRIDDTEDEESLVLIDELLNFRGITYKEYKEIFTSFFEEYEYNNLKFLKAVFINDDLRRKEFIRNHENSFEGYITCLNEFNIPILDFFLRQKMKFNLPVKELLTHAYGVGMTGSGKSEVIKNIFFSLQELSNFNNKYSLVAIEPHGNFVMNYYYLILINTTKKD
jgi:DNA helicase HerA-like ATPase